MKYEIRMGAAPVADMETILEFISRTSPEAANRFAIKVEEAINSLFLFPNRHTFAPEAAIHGKLDRHVIVGNYRIVFMVIMETVQIVRIRHTAQAPLRADELN